MPTGIYYDQGKLALAIKTYNQAIQIEPNFPEAYNNLGNALREAGRVDEAIQCYTICIQLQYQRPPATGSWRGNPQAAAAQQAQRLAVAYNNLGGNIISLSNSLLCAVALGACSTFVNQR